MKTRPLFLALAFLTGCASAPPPPADVISSVQTALDDMAQPGRRTPVAQRLITQVAVSRAGDGWLVDFGRTDDAAWCGTGGCTHRLWVERAGGPALVFDEQVREWRLRPGAPSRLDIEIHGSNCDLAGVEPCWRGYLWDDAAGRLVETVNEVGDGYLVGPLFQFVGLDETGMPDAIKTEVERREQACRDRGGAVDGTDYAAVTSPDLNGDGVRDWIVGSRFAGCVPADVDGRSSGGVSVWVSTDDGWSEALTVPENGYAVDVASVPARFGVRLDENCLDGSACLTRFYSWRDGALVSD